MFFKSAKVADARHQENRNTPLLFRWPLDTAAVLRVFFRRLGLFICAALLARAQPTDHEEVTRTIASAVESMRLGKLTEARIALESAVHQEPDNAEANLELGLLLGQLGNVPAAAEAFRKAVHTKPDSPEAHYNLGLTLVADANSTRDWPGAIREFREAVRLRPSYAEALHLLGTGLAETGERDAAIAELKAAVSANPNAADIHLDLGKALQASGDLSAAETEYREAVRIRPKFSEGELALGKLLSSASPGKPSAELESIEHFNRALRINPDNAAAQYALAQALQRAGHLDEAAPCFRQAEELTKRAERAVQCTRLSNEGLDAAKRGDRKGAVNLLRQAVDLRPDSAVAHYNLGLLLAGDVDLVPARTQIVEAISLMPLDVRFYLSLARMWQESGDGSRAREAFEIAARLDPQNPTAAAALKDLADAKMLSSLGPFPYGAEANTAEAHFAFARALSFKNDWLDAVGEWLRVLALEPDNVDARNNLGVSYAHLVQDDKAELEFRKALQVSPRSVGAHFGLAVLYLQHGKKPEAIQELRQVLSVQPDYPEAQKLLAMALN